ncbi:hypothetical protein [Anaerococcus sp. AGMB09787]|uniref:hypothetical protein n=1 Tax=Anaerococcus sp. AGMB09787 TaxID=2922869 RepID=UPI001FAF2A9B|nr:hypothetical protein [Anaerococcus sp. AGMB09787]
MSLKFRNVIKKTVLVILSFIMILPYTTVIASSANYISNNNPNMQRSDLTFIKGNAGDKNVIYTYKENGKKYKIIENADEGFNNVISKKFKLTENGDYEEIQNQNLKQISNDSFILTSKDELGIRQEKIDITMVKSYDGNRLNDELVSLYYTDPGTGERRTREYDGSSKIQDMMVSGISAVLGAALGGKVGAGIGAIASTYFQKGADRAYYHVVYNWMMSKLHPVNVVLRETQYTVFYLDAAHNYKTGSDYYEYDGRW